MRLIDCYAPLISFTLYDQAHIKAKGGDSAENIHERFLELVEQGRRCCDAHDYTTQQREEALFAIVAWIDEFRLCEAEQAGHQWFHYELQRALFNTSNGGDEFYDHLSRISSEDHELREVFIHCLSLGFRGRFFDDPEGFDQFCQDTLGITADMIGGELPDVLFASGYFPSESKRPSMRHRFLPSSFTILLVLITLGGLGAVYFFCQQSLEHIYSFLSLPGSGVGF